MTAEEAFLEAICASPADDAARLVYADLDDLASLPEEGFEEYITRVWRLVPEGIFGLDCGNGMILDKSGAVLDT